MSYQIVSIVITRLHGADHSWLPYLKPNYLTERMVDGVIDDQASPMITNR